ncbi:unnamed protein product [Peniophora sp. CBMAI 1063]|nr:unnamed protein product [Peniophora sp. CBMAI 1063]
MRVHSQGIEVVPTRSCLDFAVDALARRTVYIHLSSKLHRFRARYARNRKRKNMPSLTINTMTKNRCCELRRTSPTIQFDEPRSSTHIPKSTNGAISRSARTAPTARRLYPQSPPSLAHLK